MLSAQWIAATIRTTKSKDLRQINVYMYLNCTNSIGQMVRQELRDLDCLLVQLWTSHSIRPKITFTKFWGGNDPGDVLPSLLPELTSRVAGAVVY